MSAAPRRPRPAPSAVPASDLVNPPAEPEDDGSGRRSYKARRAESNALHRLAKALADMKPSALIDLPLPDDLRAAIEVVRGRERAARIRELRHVVALLRSHDLTSMDALERDAGRMRRQRSARERDYEAWRERLVSEGDRALAELVAQHPTADAQRLRQLVRQARRDPGSDRSKQVLRTVLRLVRQACEGQGSVAEPADETEGADADAGTDADADAGTDADTDADADADTHPAG